MTTDQPNIDTRSAFASLRRFVQPKPIRECCEMCSAELAENHAHLVEPGSRRLHCACDACAILFSGSEAAKYRRVPRDVRYLPDFRLSDVQWEGLQLPINLAFFLHSTAAGRVVALYPSPAGATEAQPPPDAWEDLVADNPSLRELQPDVEALLVNRLGPEPAYYRLGIDQCYQLVGLVRTHWKGFSGGTELWEQVQRFFDTLRQRSS